MAQTLHKLEFVPTKNTPYPALTGEILGCLLWGIKKKNWPRYITTLRCNLEYQLFTHESQVSVLNFYLHRCWAILGYVIQCWINWITIMTPGVCLYTKMLSYLYRNSHYDGQSASQLSHLHDATPYTWRIQSGNWNCGPEGWVSIWSEFLLDIELP